MLGSDPAGVHVKASGGINQVNRFWGGLTMVNALNHMVNGLTKSLFFKDIKFI